MITDRAKLTPRLRKSLVGFGFAFVWIIALCWAATWIGWYQVSFRAPTLQGAARNILQKYSYKVEPQFLFTEETSTNRDHSVHVVAFKEPDGSARYRMEIKSITPTRWAELKFERLD